MTERSRQTAMFCSRIVYDELPKLHLVVGAVFCNSWPLTICLCIQWKFKTQFFRNANSKNPKYEFEIKKNCLYTNYYKTCQFLFFFLLSKESFPF